MSGERRPRGTAVNADPSPGEVEELLRAAQDDLLLKLSVDAHTTTTSSSSSLDPDLSRRFDALRSHRGPPAPKRETPDGPSNPQDGGGGTPTAGTSVAGDGARGGRGDGQGEDEDGVSNVLEDDLAARFAALKGSSSSYLPAGSVARKPERIPKEGDDDDDSDKDESEDGDDGVSKKEVEKLMQWAMDAARLDPDPGISDDDEGIGKEEAGEGGGLESELDDDEDDAAARADEKKKKKKEDEEEMKEKKKKKAEGKKPPTRKWFFF